MDPAVQGAMIGATAALFGVFISGALQLALRKAEEGRRKDEAAELLIFYCRRLRKVFENFSDEIELQKCLSIGIALNDDDLADLEFVLAEISTKIPHTNPYLFDLRRVLKNVKTYSASWFEVQAKLRRDEGNEKDLSILESWIMTDAKRGKKDAHKAIQEAFASLSKGRRKSMTDKIGKDRDYA